MIQRLLPLAVMEKLLKDAGCQRISEDAKRALKNYLEKEARRIGKRAGQLAGHAGRRTVLGQDVNLASE